MTAAGGFAGVLPQRLPTDKILLSAGNARNGMDKSRTASQNSVSNHVTSAPTTATVTAVASNPIKRLAPCAALAPSLALAAVHPPGAASQSHRCSAASPCSL